MQAISQNKTHAFLAYDIINPRGKTESHKMKGEKREQYHFKLRFNFLKALMAEPRMKKRVSF